MSQTVVETSTATEAAPIAPATSEVVAPIVSDAAAPLSDASTLLTSEVKPEAPVERVAPETAEGYEFVFEADTNVDTKALDAFKARAHAQGFTNAEAQDMASFYEGMVKDGLVGAQESMLKQNVDWKAECANDPVIGGDKFPQSLAKATMAMERVGTPELRATFDTYGIGSHPEMVKMMVRIGEMIGEKPIPEGGAAGTTPTLAQNLYTATN